MKKPSINEFLQKIKGKKVLVLGLGIQGGGLGATRYMLRHGAKVTVYDDKSAQELDSSVKSLSTEEGIEYLFSGRKPENISDYVLVIKGPSVKWDHEVVKQAQKNNVQVAMETALFVLYSPSKVIGVTGTRGKSTTTMMIHNTLSEVYKGGKIYISGNLPGTCALDLLDKVRASDIVVLELSSWQLSGLHTEKCSPDIAVVTTLYEDHLNYYSNMHDYVFDKTAIYAYQGDTGKIVISKNFADDYFKVTKPNHKNISYAEVNNFVTALVHLRGMHNVLNASLAKEACKALLGNLEDLSLEKVIASQKHISCRQEYLATFKNVEIINDSASTTPIATVAALETFSDKDIILVLGGKSKNLSFDGLVEKIYNLREKIKSVILLKGSFTDEILPVLSTRKGLHLIGTYENFEQAIKDAFQKALSNAVPTYFLFSPGATSFAQFKNEFHRGEEFARAVSDIMNK